eukprot:611269-Pleurochrysis_carterae.AAC.2
MVDNGDSLFRDDIAREDFIDLFSTTTSPELVRFRANRFVHYLSNCENNQLDEQSSPSINLPRTHMELHEPMWDRLQSSYGDMNTKFDHIRKHEMHKHSAVLLIGCDAVWAIHA